LDLGREPYQTELEELVEKEITAVVLKNEDKKKRKGKDGALAVHTGFTNEVDERLLLLEDVVEKWEEKWRYGGRWFPNYIKLKSAKLRVRCLLQLQMMPKYLKRYNLRCVSRVKIQRRRRAPPSRTTKTTAVTVSPPMMKLMSPLVSLCNNKCGQGK
jgi:hypothetical protein